MVDKPDPDDQQRTGGVTIADSVVAKIAYTACREIDGVHALGGATSRALSSLASSVRGGESRTQGVSVDLHDDVVDVDVTLVIEYGASIPQVGETCRAAVKEKVEGVTGLTVRTVNIVVSDIDFAEEAPGKPAGQA
ncbi:MAG TPA: Asp23/Gls24 family envelope stress response protein [Thermoleophilia bacterium]|nr:Asp23/Gls24 family envelope stress response protein [Thermoleophilia bacterium]